MLSDLEALRQNTIGNSEGRPVGVPTSYDWYDGAFQPAAAAPSGFTSVTAWGQVYQTAGEAAYASSQAEVEVANAETYVHLQETGEWVLVQSQASTPIAGGHYVVDFSGNSAEAMPVTTGSDGLAAFAAPPDGYNNHFWPTARGTYPVNAVDAVYVQMDMRVNDPNLNLVANIGADWWRSASAPFVDGFGNNPGAGMNNWTELTTEWQTLAFTSSNAILAADPPPPLERSLVEPTPTVPPIEVPPVVDPDPTASTDDNLLINGLFEATPVASSGWNALMANGMPGGHAPMVNDYSMATIATEPDMLILGIGHDPFW